LTKNFLPESDSEVDKSGINLPSEIINSDVQQQDGGANLEKRQKKENSAEMIVTILTRGKKFNRDRSKPLKQMVHSITN
jgi:hypothetical protein